VAVAGGYAYVAGEDAGLRVIEFYEVAVEKGSEKARETAKMAKTVVFGGLKIEPENKTADLLDISGRKVLELKPGKNDVGCLTSGVYFIKWQGARSRVNKVVIVR
jgi:hypothetical protein